MIEKLYSLLFYASAEPEDLKSCRAEIQQSNKKKLISYLSISCVFLFALALLSLMLIGREVLWRNHFAYGIGLAVCIGLLLVAKVFPDKNGWLLTWEMYAFEAAIYVLGIYIGVVSTTDQPATSFLAFLLAVPLVFIMRPIQRILNIIVFDIAFMVCARIFDEPRIVSMDIINGVVFGILSCILSTFVMTTMYENFIVRSKLSRIAERDLSTGLLNRNAYEEKVRDYPMQCSSTLSCIYADVNNLHELNNTQGHAAGDRMLKVVGRSMQAIFGEENTYRIGGDEFVAFAIDQPTTEVRTMLKHFTDAVETQGYSVAVGVTTLSAGGIDVDALVKLAEQRMYADKSNHYHHLERTR